MCLIVLAWRLHPGYPCVLAANRDEFLARPTEAAHWWPGEPPMLAGRDLEAGGTWLGVTRSGRFAALTNYRDRARQRAGAPSRGALVTTLLRGPQALPAAMAGAVRAGQGCNPWNLLAGDAAARDGALLYHASTTGETLSQGPGLYLLSNHLLDTPWPKVLRARAGFAEALAQLPDTREVLRLLQDRDSAADDQLPDTGIGLDAERQLSPIHIRAPGYGTRSTTLFTVRADGEARFQEWTWGEQGELTGERPYTFLLTAAR
jgi:uncharacterized protein with NRDE domain